MNNTNPIIIPADWLPPVSYILLCRFNHDDYKQTVAELIISDIQGIWNGQKLDENINHEFIDFKDHHVVLKIVNQQHPFFCYNQQLEQTWIHLRRVNSKWLFALTPGDCFPPSDEWELGTLDHHLSAEYFEKRKQGANI